MSKLTKHFSYGELGLEGKALTHAHLEEWRAFARELEILRWALACPLVITSGYRSPSHNRLVGGAKRSQHLRVAADIQPRHFDKLSPIGQEAILEKMANFIRRGMRDGVFRKGGVGLYNAHVHWDPRGTMHFWKGVSK